jgi:hypothetical protein
MKTLSMQMTVCPYNLKTCGSNPTNIVLQANETRTLYLSSASNKYFNSTAICYYTITANLQSYSETDKSKSMIWVAAQEY